MSYLYVPGLVASNSGSDSPALRQPSFAMWRGKSIAPRTWSRLCKRASWMRLLSGLTCEPSTASRGVDSWIASRRATRASRSPSRDHAAALAILAICGQQSRGSSASANPQSSFWRTSPAICPLDSITSAPIWEAWVTGLRQEYSRRRKLAHRTDGNGCSSWPTSAANDDNKSVEAHLAMKQRMPGGPRNTITSLQVATKAWTTPQAHDVTERGIGQVPTSEAGNACLARDAKHWPTPRAEMDSGKHRGETDTLHSAGKNWSSPSSHDGRRPGHEQDSKQGANLKRDAEQWGTPNAHERTHTSRKVDHGIQLATQASGHPDPPTIGETSQADTGPRSLNPNFVEWLMGVPPGLSDFARLEMPLSLWWQRMRLELSRVK